MNTKDTRSAGMLVDALPRFHPPFGGAYIAALRAAGYDDSAIQGDYLMRVRGDAGQSEEKFLVAMGRRTREVGKQ